MRQENISRYILYTWRKKICQDLFNAYVLTNVYVFPRYIFIDVITIINTQLKNISINYLLFDSNTRRIILISLSDPNTNSKLLIPCFNAFIDNVIPGMFSAEPLQILKRVCQYNFKTRGLKKRDNEKFMIYLNYLAHGGKNASI